MSILKQANYIAKCYILNDYTDDMNKVSLGNCTATTYFDLIEYEFNKMLDVINDALEDLEKNA